MRNMHRKGIAMTLSIVLFVLLAVPTVYQRTAEAADEFDALRLKAAGASNYDVTDPDIAAKLTDIDSAVSSCTPGPCASGGTGYWDTLVKSPQRTYLWNDLSSPFKSAQIATAYTRISAMSTAYATVGSSVYGNTALKNDILAAMDWMYANRYNETMSEGKETSDNSWYHWEIGAPSSITAIVLRMYHEFSPAQIANYMNAVEKFCPDPSIRTMNGTEIETGANRVWKARIVANRGIIVKSAEKLEKARDALSQVLAYTTSGDGFYKDGSFIQHNKHPYNGGYGKALLGDIAVLIELLKDSTWEVMDPNLGNLYQWVYDAFEPLIYKGSMMDMVRGREISRYAIQDHEVGHLTASAILNIASFAPPADALRMKSMVKYWILSDTYSSFYTNRPISTIAQAKALMNDASIPSRGELIKFKNYSNMDRAVQLRPGYGLGLSLSSNRIFNYESISNVNMKSWYTADGMSYLYNSDLSQFDDNFWPTVNPYRLPGTTVDTLTRTMVGVNYNKEYVSPNHWTGGSEIADLYGAVGMDLKASGDRNASGAVTTPSSLTAKKSWFLFDDEIVALGAGITSTDSRTIETTVENRKINTAGDNNLTVNGMLKPSALGWSESMTDVNWAHLAGPIPGSDIGYYFPGTAEVSGLREARTGKWGDITTSSLPKPDNPVTRNYLTLWLNHGVNPANSGYSYVTLPNKTDAQVGAYAANPDIEILENTTSVQAVKETRLNVVGMNFWTDTLKWVQANGLPFLASNKKASVMTQETADGIEVSVSDPTHLNTGTVDIEINRMATGIEFADPTVSVTQLTPTIKFSVKVSGTTGASHKVKFRYSPFELYEAEGLTPAVSAGTSSEVFNSANLSGGAGRLYNAYSVGNYIEFAVHVPQGTYDVKANVKKRSTRGIYQFSIDGTNQGPVKDHYTAVDSYEELDLGRVSFLAEGDRTFRFTVTGRNDSSTGYSMGLDYIKLIPVVALPSLFEAESLSASVSPGVSHELFTGSYLSGGAGRKLNANGAGDTITFDVPVPAATAYAVKVRVKKQPSRGIFQLSINGTDQGTPQDNYSTSDLYEELDLGVRTFEAASSYPFKFTVTGKQASSTGYSLGLDSIKLIPQ